MGLIPAFRLLAGDEDRTDRLRDRLMVLTVTTHTDHRADELVLEFDDAGTSIALPRHGAVLDLSLGYADAPLHRQGRFTVDTSSPEGPPDKIVVRAKSADVRSSLKVHKSRAFRATTVGAVLRRLASDNGLQAAVHADLAALPVAHLDQTKESDLHLATRLGRRHDAIASVKGGRLIFAPKGQAVSATGKAWAAATFAREDLARWRAIDTDRPKAGRVRAAWYNPAAGALAYEEEGDEEPTQQVRHVHASSAAAKAAARALHRRATRDGRGVAFEPFEGRADLSAGRAVVLTGLREGLAGRWVAEKVEHRWDFDGAGARTTVEATVDGGPAGGQ